MMHFFDDRLPDRFWKRVSPEPMSGCWIWIGSIFRYGYGAYFFDGWMRGAHQASFAAEHGFVPRRPLVIDHLCRVPLCVNPGHLEAVTDQINTLRGIGPAAKQARQTECKRGHAFDRDNTILSKTRTGGFKRQCRACAADNYQRAKELSRQSDSVVIGLPGGRSQETKP